MSDELDKLKREIANLKNDYTNKLDILLSRIETLESNESTSQPEQVPVANVVSQPETEKPRAHVKAEQTTNQTQETQAVPKQPDPWLQSEVTQKTHEKSFSQQVQNDIVDVSLMAGLQKLLGPFNSVIDPIVSLYNKYKEEDKLAVFFLTFSGILALVLGFAYILQYSFSNLLNEVAKLGIGFIASVAVIVLGARISSKESRMQEYGASLIGLGVILVYLCLFFMTSYYSMLNPAIGFILLAANTFAGYLLAFRYEARIIAGISFIGGAFTPFFLGHNIISAFYFASYLLLLSAASLRLANKISWPALSFISFIIVVAIFEYVIFGNNIRYKDIVPFTILIHLFFYLFVSFSIFSGKTLRDEYNKQQVYIIAGSAVFLLANLYALDFHPLTLGILYLINALPFTALIYPMRWAITANQRVIMLVLVGSLAGFAIPAIFDMNIVGLFWALEGMLILHLGFQFNSTFIRREAYLLLIISLMEMIWFTMTSEIYWERGLLHIAYLNLLAIGLVLWILGFTINKHKDKCEFYDNHIKQISAETLSAWIAVTYFVTSYFLFTPYHLLISIVPLFYLLYRGHKRELLFTQYLGFAHYTLLIVQILLSYDQANSLRFTAQPLVGKIAIIEAFVLLALLQSFYEKFAADSKWLTLANNLRIAFFFLLPLVLLPTILRRANEFFSIALWGSFVVSYLIANWTKHPLHRREGLALYVVATIYSIVFAFTYTPQTIFGPVSIGLYLGPLVGFAMIVREKGFSRPGYKISWCAPIITLWYIHLAIVMSLVIYVIFAREDLSIMTLGIYFILISLRSPTDPALRHCLKPFYYSGFFILASVVIIHTADKLYYSPSWLTVLLNIIVLAILFKSATNTGKAHQLILGSRKIMTNERRTMELWVSHSLLAVAYTTAFYMFTGDLLGPVLTIALVIHATVVLFMSLREFYKPTMHIASILFALTILKIFANDLEGFSLIQKVMAFMVIGVILLGAAYKFQQFRNAQQQTD